MSSNTQNQVTAFFGATGGCASTALALSLQAGYKCTARKFPSYRLCLARPYHPISLGIQNTKLFILVARNPSKLTDLLKTNFHLTEAHFENLTIVPGAVQDMSAVKQVLAPSSTGAVDNIIFGVGGSPSLNSNPFKGLFTLDNPNVCQEGARTIVEALSQLKEEGAFTNREMPRMSAISTTGVSEKQRDVPLAYYLLYHWILKVPHVDKREMERITTHAAASYLASDASPDRRVLSHYTLIRPTFLNSCEAKGLENIKVGWETYEEGADARKRKDEAGPKTGYPISRADVGAWIFENRVKNVVEWDDRCVTVTG
jgi:hypothetical protein